LPSLQPHGPLPLPGRRTRASERRSKLGYRKFTSTAHKEGMSCRDMAAGGGWLLPVCLSGRAECCSVCQSSLGIMQPDQKQSFIQRLREPTGWLVADLALDCRAPSQAPQSCSHPPAFFLRKVTGEGRDGCLCCRQSPVRCVTGRMYRGLNCFLLAKHSLNGTI